MDYSSIKFDGTGMVDEMCEDGSVLEHRIYPEPSSSHSIAKPRREPQQQTIAEEKRIFCD
jgi:hypothetical protein